MNKIEFVKEIARRTYISETKVNDVVCETLALLTEQMQPGRKGVSFVGFGSFECRKVKERAGVDPRTGEKIIIPAYYAPQFRSGKKLKDIINGKRKNVYEEYRQRIFEKTKVE